MELAAGRLSYLVMTLDKRHLLVNLGAFYSLVQLYDMWQGE